MTEQSITYGRNIRETGDRIGIIEFEDTIERSNGSTIITR